ncbi:MAG: hypothetical protein KDB88_13275 [Flavobacteriales bacterium]|nr:hypothetical protein [Flavobacteriales bacterium]
MLTRSVALTFNLIVVHALLGQASVGRELVPNGSFEEVSGTVKTWDQFPLVTGWSNVTLGISEVFDRGAPSKSVGIPENDYGSIEPKNGDRYSGFFAWKDDKRYNMYAEGLQDPVADGWNVYAEYIQVELREPLEEDKTYAISFWVALAQHSDRAVSAIGAYCSPFPLAFQHRKFLAESADVYTEAILDQRGEWVEISGTFVAYGEETHLIIGTFPYVGFDTKKIVEGPDNQYAYYYVDQVSLKEVVPDLGN